MSEIDTTPPEQTETTPKPVAKRKRGRPARRSPKAKNTASPQVAQASPVAEVSEPAEYKVKIDPKLLAEINSGLLVQKGRIEAPETHMPEGWGVDARMKLCDIYRGQAMTPKDAHFYFGEETERSKNIQEGYVPVIDPRTGIQVFDRGDPLYWHDKKVIQDVLDAQAERSNKLLHGADKGVKEKSDSSELPDGAKYYDQESTVGSITDSEELEQYG